MRYEYKVLDFESEKFENLESELNKLAEEGWRVVCPLVPTYQGFPRSYLLILERQHTEVIKN